MNKHKQGNTPQNGAERTESPQERFLRESVGLFLKSNDLAAMTVQNDYGAIMVKRNENGKTVTHAIGFQISDDGDDYDEDGDDYEENEQDEQAAINKFVRWL